MTVRSATPSNFLKLVAMFADDFERFHIKLELHLVSGWRRCVRLKAAVIDFYVVNVLVAALLERRGNPCPFLIGGGTVLKGSCWSEGDSSDNYLCRPSIVALPSRGSSLEALSHPAAVEVAGPQQKQGCFQSKELFSPWRLFASFCSKCLASCHDLP
jgi:hypothetical protein